MPKGGKPIGKYAVENSRGMIKQNQTADLLAKEGYLTEMLDELPNGNGKGISPTANPDFLIEGNVFDCYSPEPGANIDNICRTIKDKTKAQSERIILNLDDFNDSDFENLCDSIMRKTSESGDLRRLSEMLIARNGKITRLFGR